ncbi:hypothetical protein AB0M86_47185, partial [Streptomyces sp. NPDC051639]|uniref:hypothetical protein n=1 Tax=Streptomyces sp. NPDC051639 TaxID=3155671 RepID=UPI00344735A4
TEMAAAVRLGRYLDVEITLVHGGGLVMRGLPVVRCHPIEAFDSELSRCGFFASEPSRVR